MSNYADYDKPVPCPYCEFPMHADFVDVGVGMAQCGPYQCDSCGASQQGPEVSEPDFDKSTLDEDEQRTGFYKNKISPLANTHNGKIITAKQADAIYRANYFMLHGNPYNAKVIR